MLSWETFQPRTNHVSTRALDRLVLVADLAERHSLRLLPCLLACHAGGVNWAPPWGLLAREQEGRWPVFSLGRLRWNVARNLYADPEVLEAQVLYFREVSNALRGHPALWAWDLASAPSRFADSPEPESLHLWLRVMTEELRSADARLPVTMTLCPEDLWKPGGHGRRGVPEFLDFLSLYAVRGSCPYEIGPLDSACPAFLGLLAQWLCGGSAMLIAACGVATRPAGIALEKLNPEGRLGFVGEEEGALYLEQVLERCWRAGLKGALAWCYADCVPSFGKCHLSMSGRKSVFAASFARTEPPSLLRACSKSSAEGVGERNIAPCLPPGSVSPFRSTIRMRPDTRRGCIVVTGKTWKKRVEDRRNAPWSSCSWLFRLA